MKTENLSVGMSVKNYPELCKVLEVEEKRSGKSRIYQIVDFERHFSYEKKGNKFIITEVFDTPEEKKKRGGNNKLPFIDEMELLVIDLLLATKENELIISDSKLLKELSMVNHYYYTFMNNKQELADKLKMNIAFINDYYDGTNSTFKSAIDTVMKSLSNKKLIIHEKVMMVIKVHTNVSINSLGQSKTSDLFEYDIEKDKFSSKQIALSESFREANEIERQIILKIENEIMTNDYEATNIQDIFYSGKINEYYTKLNKRLFDELNIKRAYMANRITINHDALKREINRNMNKVQQLYALEQCNLKVIDRLNENAENRHKKAFINKDSYTTRLRRDKSYVKYNVNLTENLIDRNTVELKEVPKSDIEEAREKYLELFNDETLTKLFE